MCTCMALASYICVHILLSDFFLIRAHDSQTTIKSAVGTIVGFVALLLAAAAVAAVLIFAIRKRRSSKND